MDKVDSAIFRIQQASEMSEHLYHKPLMLTYSGGKDSDILLRLAEISGVDYSVRHSLTTVDAPETVQHIRKVFHKLEDNGIPCVVDIHKRKEGGVDTMWNLIIRHGSPPLRISRYCCTALKETGGKGEFVVLGVRRAESAQRSKRSTFEIITPRLKDKIGVMNMDNEEDRETFESCPIKGERAVNPIIDWTNEDVWDFIHEEGIETNPLYECGYERVGCVGCPLKAVKSRAFDFEKYPKYKENYIKTFDKMLAERERRGMKPWRASECNGNAVFEWWMQ